jgi:hypothetical protein
VVCRCMRRSMDAHWAASMLTTTLCPAFWSPSLPITSSPPRGTALLRPGGLLLIALNINLAKRLQDCTTASGLPFGLTCASAGIPAGAVVLEIVIARSGDRELWLMVQCGGRARAVGRAARAAAQRGGRARGGRVGAVCGRSGATHRQRHRGGCCGRLGHARPPSHLAGTHRPFASVAACRPGWDTCWKRSHLSGVQLI